MKDHITNHNDTMAADRTELSDEAARLLETHECLALESIAKHAPKVGLIATHLQLWRTIDATYLECSTNPPPRAVGIFAGSYGI